MQQAHGVPRKREGGGGGDGGRGRGGAAARRDHRCGCCGAAFAAEAYLEQHMHTHNERRIHHCGECGKSFQSAPSLSQHRQIHSLSGSAGEPEQEEGGQPATAAARGRFRCEECKRDFKTPR